ncbi:uncharacterized protein [Narcine bancroftii]|uniref:uncharacterized protein isoform X1 n=1 Tax=Narcine bancroftii TaxID=1343680 RepID=UPI0038319D0F
MSSNFWHQLLMLLQAQPNSCFHLGGGQKKIIQKIYLTHCLNMAAFHMEALRKQRILDKKISKQELLVEKNVKEHFKIAESEGKITRHRICKTETESGSYGNSKSYRISESSGRSKMAPSSSTLSTKSSGRSASLSEIPEKLKFKDQKSRLSKRTTLLRIYQNIPPGMSPAWYHHLNKQAKVLRDHGLVMGHLSQFVN